MKKLFVSQPMKDKTDEEILAVREKAIASAKEKLGEDVEVIEQRPGRLFRGAGQGRLIARKTGNREACLHRQWLS